MSIPGRVAQLVRASTWCAKVAGSVLGQGTYKNQPMNMSLSLPSSQKKKVIFTIQLRKYTEDLVKIYDRHPNLEWTQESLWEGPGEPCPCSQQYGL